MSKASGLFSRKPLALLLEEEQNGEGRLRRVLGPVGLTSLGVGGIIGTGIFVLIGKAAHDQAGPALMLSFVAAGIACIFAALCYAEFAAMVPVAGSAYTYAYATLGELFAWIIGWDLVLEYAVASSTVASGWSHYFQNLIGIFGLKVPEALSGPPIAYETVKTAAGTSTSHFVTTGHLFDLPAVAISLILTVILVVGIRESSRVNALMVLVKLAVVAFVIIVGATLIDPANWHPFAPYGYSGISFFGQGGGDTPRGVLAGAAGIFFAYIGFDSVSAHSEEARNPRRDVPIGILVSLVLCTLLYVAVAAVLTGMVRYDQIDIGAPVAAAFQSKGRPMAQLLIAIGALTGITSVQLVMMLSQPRVFLAMARDGLLPESFFGAIHPKFRTPWKSTILTGTVVAAMAAVLPLDVLAELVNIGTLMAFTIVCAGVLVMRRTNPEAERPFRVPFVPVIPLLGIVTCLILMFSLPPENWVRLFVWLLLGFIIYFAYGRRRSVLAHSRANRPGSAG